MSTRTSYDHGTPSWVDLMSPDVDASKAFYSALFGWDTRDEFDDDGNRIYVDFSLDGKSVCGLGGQQPGMEGMPAIWNSYVAVDDAEAIVARVDAAGGKVMMPPMTVMEDVGKMAIFADPTGAAFSVWEAGTHIGAGVVNETNTYSWNELVTRDVETAKRFYSEVFGWEYDAMEMGPMGTYNVIKGGEEGGLGGLMSMPEGMPDQVPNHWMVYFLVEDVDAAVAKVAELGGQQVQEPFDAPGVGRIAIVHDPHGGSFSVMTPESAQG